MDSLVSFSHVDFNHGSTAVLQDISFSLGAGEILTVIGPNGAGKSTLVKLAVGLLQPNAGSVSKASRLRVGFMPQKLHIDSTLPISVGRFLGLATRDRAAIERQSERLKVSSLLHSPLQGLSGGELQRVLLARALLRKPQLLVLDEPTQGVDVLGQAELYRIISELRDELGCGVLMVSHDLHLVMAQTDTVICLNHHICCQGAPSSVGRHPEYLQLFGGQAAADIAVYTHHHDHEHNLHGDVVPNDPHSSCQHP